MSTLGRNQDSERYRQLQRLGWNLDLDRTPIPIPHWESSQRLLPSQDDDDWAIQGAESTDEYVLVEDGAGNVVFDLKEVV